MINKFSATSILLGKIKLKKIDGKDNTFCILPDVYDFNIEWSNPSSTGMQNSIDKLWNLANEKWNSRNKLTILAYFANNFPGQYLWSQPYTIFVNGNIYIKP